MAGGCADVPPGLVADLGAVLHLPGGQEAARLLRLAREAERDLLAQPGYRAELARWAGGDRDRDGIPDTALAPHDPRMILRIGYGLPVPRNPAPAGFRTAGQRPGPAQRLKEGERRG
jgi:hypothetical protein